MSYVKSLENKTFWVPNKIITRERNKVLSISGLECFRRQLSVVSKFDCSEIQTYYQEDKLELTENALYTSSFKVDKY